MLNYGLSEGINLAGVTTSYVYVGAWKSMFCWHKEDMDLYSVNYLHAGASKYWYSIDVDCNEAFENYVNSLFPEKVRLCKEFLRHKMTMIHPENLLERGIRMRKVVHKPREFVISRAAGYHSGFNSGFNIAEAVNFALLPWISIAHKAKPCLCIADSVRLDIGQFKLNLFYKSMDNILPITIPADLLAELKKHSEKFFSSTEEVKDYCLSAKNNAGGSRAMIMNSSRAGFT